MNYLVIIAMSMSFFAQVQKLEHKRVIRPIIYGRVSMAPLEDFAPTELQYNCHLLITRNLSEAAAVFAATYDKNPDDIVVFIGMAQSNPSRWPSEISKLEKKANLSGLDKYKLGLMIFYKWGSQAERGSHEDIVGARVSRLLKEAYESMSNPLIGLTLLETTDLQPIDVNTKTEIMRKLLISQAGGQAYGIYLKAATSDWQSAIPDAGLIPNAKRHPLIGILKNLWSDCTATSKTSATDASGKMVMKEDPINPLSLKQADYIDRWIQALKKAK